ncbi:MAG: hypothetical protein SH850_23250 [Planctomycetaceae bacterium]|nr:hypothetical protein [Planctomycetaceae bacterium]
MAKVVGIIRHVDPRLLHISPSRPQGADPGKLQKQIALYGRSADGMPPIWVTEMADGEFVINNGMTRATRIAKIAPGTLVPIIVIDRSGATASKIPTVGERLP